MQRVSRWIALACSALLLNGHAAAQQGEPRHGKGVGRRGNELQEDLCTLEQIRGVFLEGLDQDGPRLAFTPDDWRAFLRQVKDGRPGPA